MENCDAPVLLQDHDYCRGRRISTRRAEGARRPAAYRQCPCCRDNQHEHSATAARLPQKRKRTSAARPSKPSPEDAEVPPTPQPSTPAAEIPQVLNLSTIPHAELPVISYVAHRPQPSTAALHHDGPLNIHGRSVEEYQRIYHEVVDDMLRYKSGMVRPYTVELGRRIKHKLWERLDRPTMSSSVDEDGRVNVDVSYGAGVHPPSYDVDISGEPSPGKPPKKRAKQ